MVVRVATPGRVHQSDISNKSVINETSVLNPKQTKENRSRVLAQSAATVK